MAHRLTGFDHLLDRRSHMIRLFPVGIIAHFHAMKPNLRQAQGRMENTFIKRFFGSIGQAANLGRHTQPEYIVYCFQHRSTGSEIPAQQYLSAFTVNSLLRMGISCVLFQKDTGISQTELINRLLHITNQEQILLLFRQCAIDRILHRIGILVFIHHHFPETAANLPGHMGNTAAALAIQKIQCMVFQIAEVQDPAAALHAIILMSAEVLTGEFMLLARTKGLTKRQAIMRHALRNSMVVIFPSILSEFIMVFSGSLIYERMFGINGVGELYLNSINYQDYDFFMMLSGFYTLISLLAGIVTDISMGFIDPRIKMGAR